jgi:predicted glycoside hydrolase/deacetylase ChbG (UPF0249 family)
MLSSELLGFPPDARVLIINADDFGMYSSINTAVVRSIEDGIASSCSIMPPCPGAPEALRLLQARRHIPFGVHLTLVCDFSAYLWGPVSPREKVPSLLDDAGHLFTTATKARLLAKARIEHVELELRSQIDMVLATGLMPTHLDWHALADGGRDDIFALGLALAQEYGLAARVWLEPGRQVARRRGLPAVDHDFLDSFNLDVTTKQRRYLELLHELPAGLTEWAVHPGLADAEARAIDPGWQVRHSDLDFLISSEAQEVVSREGIVIIGYGDIRNVWRKA